MAIWRSFFELSILSLKPRRFSCCSASMMRSMYCGVENGFGRRTSNFWMHLATVSTLSNTILVVILDVLFQDLHQFLCIQFPLQFRFVFLCLKASDKVAGLTYSHVNMHVNHPRTDHLHFSGQMRQLPLESMTQHPAHKHPALSPPHGLCDVTLVAHCHVLTGWKFNFSRYCYFHLFEFNILVSYNLHLPVSDLLLRLPHHFHFETANN